METISLDPYRKYAVVVGIAEYESISNLPNADEDALNWTQELQSRGFKSQHIIQLINSSATKSNVQDNVTWMADIARSHDVIAFTFAGHGGPNDINNSDDGFLRTYEFIDDDNATGKYHDDEFFDDISDTDASQAFVFIDACRSGCFIDEFGNASSEVKSKFFVVSGCPWNGLTFDLIYTRQYMPSNRNDFDAGTPLAYNGAWTYFFLNASSNYPSSSMESIYSTAYSDYANWYNRTLGHVSWSAPFGPWTWSRWDWPPGSGTGLGDGVPQNIDGDSSESFYL